MAVVWIVFVAGGIDEGYGGGEEDVLSSLSLEVGSCGDSCVCGFPIWLWGSEMICP